MIKLIKKYFGLSFEEKTTATAKLSVAFNFIFGVFKIILAFFYDIFLLGAGILNFLLMICKLQCYLGIKEKSYKKFDFRNKLISLFLFLSGIQYALYLGRFIYADVNPYRYEMVLAICIATVSFIELGLAIRGMFISYGKGHYYRNIKLINFCSAMTAIVLTEIALLSFTTEADVSLLNGLFGISVGVLISLIAIFILFAPKFSLEDREYNVYKIDGDENIFKEDKIEIKLTNSKIYGNYIYIGNKKDNFIEGKIIKGKSPIKSWNIFILILIIVLSEILIFPYVIGALIFYLKGINLTKKLDNEMKKIGYVRINEEVDFNA